jgi:hypothetical protein
LIPSQQMLDTVAADAQATEKKALKHIKYINLGER